MAFEEDYLMKMVKQAVRALVSLALGKDLPPYELPDEQKNYTDTDRLYATLIQLANEGKFDEAENLLFENIDTGIQDIFRLGINFYLYVNEFPNQQLESNGYSREEIIEGIQDFSKECGIEVSDTFFQFLS